MLSDKSHVACDEAGPVRLLPAPAYHEQHLLGTATRNDYPQRPLAWTSLTKS